LIGETIDGYIVQGKLNEGGQSDLYHAQGPGGERVVLKMMRVEKENSEETRRRFEREVSLMQAIQHPHIVPILHSGYIANQVYLVMPYIPGKNLGELMEERRFSPLEVWGILDPISQALAAGHEKNIIHRDLKPENILVEERESGPYYYLSDFGFAKRPGMDQTLTANNTTLGTPDYMPPEVITKAALEARSDLYSLAVVVYELLLGQTPFTGSTMMVIMGHVNSKAPSMIEQNPAFPPNLNAIIMRNLAKTVEGRHASVRVFAESYKQALDALPPEMQQKVYWIY
jgi:serine/threonine-protein kinase